MKCLLLLILSTLLATPASAADILIIQSHRSPQFDGTVRQIQNSCGKKSQTYIMGDYAEFDLDRIVREERPRLVVAVGDKPLKEARKLRSTPVVYAMALSAEEDRPRDNITGVSMHASPENYLKLLARLGLRRAGVVYSKGKSGGYITRAKNIAASYGIELVAIQVKTPQETGAALSRLASSDVDAIWMIPDTIAVTSETVDAYIKIAQSINKPLISFSKAYLEKGALAALEASRQKMTEQLCDRIRLILTGADPADTPLADIGDATLHTNETVARRFGFNFSGTDQLLRSRKE